MPTINENLTTEQETAIDNQDVTTTPGVIDVETLEDTPAPLPEATPTTAPTTLSAAEAHLEQNALQAEKAKEEQERADKLRSEQSEQELIVQTIAGETLGQGAAETQAFAEAGVGAKQAEIDSLDSAILAASKALKLAQVQDERDIQSLAGQGRGIPASVVRGRQALMQQQRNADRKVEAIELENDIATSQLLQGKVDSAKKAITRAVELKFADKKAELQLEKDFLSRIDTKEATARQEAIRREEKVIEKAEEEADAVFGVATMASGNGAPASIIAKINKAETKQEALALAGRYGVSISDRIAQAKRGDEVKALSEKLDVTPAALAQAEKQLDDVRKLSDTSFKRTSAGLDIKDGEITDIIIAPSGTKLRAQRGVGSQKAAAQDYVSNVETIISTLTMNTFQEAKAKGLTFGAMQESEWNMLANTATALSQRRIQNNKGKVLGYSGSPEEFMSNIDELTSTIEGSYERATGFAPKPQYTVDNQGNVVVPIEQSNEDFFTTN